MIHRSKVSQVFENIASKITHFSGSLTAFFGAVTIVLLWLVTGPIFEYSDTWQLIINTGTTIITFLMVFLIQKTQNKDSLAMQLKLNELLSAEPKASNRMVNIEDLSEEELKILHRYYSRLASLAKREHDIKFSHSENTADVNHAEKMAGTKKKNKAS